MTVINGFPLLQAEPIKDMVVAKTTGPGGTSYGLGEAGYDIRIKQSIMFHKVGERRIISTRVHEDDKVGELSYGRFALASAIEEFQMPPDLMGIVHDKSTWARRGLSIFNTVIEPGFVGGLTLELVYHGQKELIIPAGSGIAQVIFHQIVEPAWYSGKYQHQGTDPVPARDSI